MRRVDAGVMSALLLLGASGCASAPAPAARATTTQARPIVITAEETTPVRVESEPVEVTETETDLASIEIPPPPAEGTIVAPERVELDEEPPPVARRPSRSGHRRVRPTTLHDPVFSAPTVFAP